MRNSTRDWESGYNNLHLYKSPENYKTEKHVSVEMKIRLAIFCSDSVQCSKFEWNGKMQRKLVVSQGRVPTAAAASLNEGHEGT